MKNKTAVFFLLLFAFSLPAFAAITVDSVQGSLLITQPDGSVKLVDAGEAIPEIQSQSALEVFEGTFKVTVGPDDKVRVACGGNEAEVSGGGTAILQCSQTGGLLTVVAGTAHLREISGEESDVPAGSEKKLNVVQLNKAKPVAAPTDELGTPVEPVTSEPDSRSIEASVSQ